MAISIGDASRTGGNTISAITIPAFTFVPTEGYLAVVAQEVGTGVPNIPTLTGGGTWAQENTVTSTSGRITLFSITGINTTADVVADCGGQSQSGLVLHVHFVTGDDASSLVVQTATNTTGAATSLSATLGAFGSPANATFAALAVRTNSVVSIVAGSGFSLISTDRSQSLLKYNSEWRADTSTTADFSWTGSNPAVLVAAEIRAAAPMRPGGMIRVHNFAARMRSSRW